MSDSPTTAAFPFDRWSLYLFVTGLFAPIVFTVFGHWGAALSFGLLAQLLALIFGLLGRRSSVGKVGLIGSAIVLASVIIMGGAWWSAGEPAGHRAPPRALR
ncbi:MAG: hypothetical protein WED34_19935 [Planctomycetales bacterium]